MLKDSRCTDTTFIFAGQQIQAHSVILGARSEVLDKELNGSMKESFSKVIVILPLSKYSSISFTLMM